MCDDAPELLAPDRHAARIASQEHGRYAHCAPSIMFAERHPCTHEVCYDANTSLAIDDDLHIKPLATDDDIPIELYNAADAYILDLGSRYPITGPPIITAPPRFSYLPVL